MQPRSSAPGKALLGLVPLAFALSLAACDRSGQLPEVETARVPALVIHGGAGTLLRENISEQEEREYNEALAAALEAGYSVLTAGGSAVDAVETTLRLMEDSPLFNAGKGAPFPAGRASWVYWES